MKKVLLTAILIFALLTTVMFGNQITEAKIYQNITIKADGSVNPSTAPIQNVGNIYTFIDDIFGEIAVERDSVIVDGNGFKLQGSGSGMGLSLRMADNVTVQNTNIQNFTVGIEIGSNNTISGNTVRDSIYGLYSNGGPYNSIISGNNLTSNDVGIYFWGASHITVSGNNIIKNSEGFHIYGSHNTISGNNITSNTVNGLFLYNSCSNNTISGNTIKNNSKGIYIVHSWNNTFFENNIADNNRGMDFFLDHSQSSNNTIYSNNFANNNLHILISTESVNVWDNGVEGNYWDNYTGVDSNNNGIGDTPFVISGYNIDRYPIMPAIIKESPSPNISPTPTQQPTPSWTPIHTDRGAPNLRTFYMIVGVVALALIIIIVAVALVYFRKHKK